MPPFAMAGIKRDRRAKIIVTLGPASDDEEVLEHLLRSGMDACRLNLSFGELAEHETRIERVRKLAARVARRPVAIIVDLPGRKLRLTTTEPHTLKTGDTVRFRTDEKDGALSVPPAFFHDNMARGDQVLLADGVVELETTEVSETEVEARVVYGGKVSPETGVHLPGMALRGSVLTEKDVPYLEMAVRQKVDYVALTYVGDAADVLEVREKLEELGRSIPIIAKIERSEAFARLDGILRRSDAVMIRRGDLGAQIEMTRVPLVQKQILTLASQRGVPVIIATQMLNSMVTDPRPTRAEASDVANAVADGADGVLLSAETAIGQHPIRAVDMMARIIRETELEQFEARAPKYETDTHDAPFADTTARVACLAAAQTGARLIVCFTESGRTARLVAKYRPEMPIIAFCSSEEVRRRLTVVWGIRSTQLEVVGDVEEMVGIVEDRLASRGLLKQGDRVCIVFGAPVGEMGHTNSVRLHEIGSKFRTGDLS